ncbi:MAG: TolC family protein [Phycisphaerales bacterium]
MLLVLFTGCSPSRYVADADREVARLLDRYDDRALGDRREWIRYPTETPGPEGEGEGVQVEAEAPEADDPPTAPPIEPREIDLDEALALAFTSSREFEDRVEALYLQGLGFTLTRYNFGPIVNATIGYLWSDREGSDESDSFDASAAVSQILPTGGDLSVSSSLAGARVADPSFFDLSDNTTFDSTVAVNLRQPLLRGAGYEVSHEALTQGQRNLIYAVRSFELFREDFSIRVAERYFDLVRQQQQLRNDERNYEAAVFDREKAEAMRQTDRNRDEDVFLARRREIEAEDALLRSRTNFELSLDDFKILLGLPTSWPIEIVDLEPEFEPVRIDPVSAVEVALHNRLDLQTERDQVEDAERAVRIARNGLLPDLDLTAAYGYAGRGDRLSQATPDDWSSTIGLSFDIPLQQLPERNAYRASLIAAEQAQRTLSRTMDEIERDILNQLRELEQFEKRIELQREQIEREKRAVAVMQVRVESGDAQTRDLLDARQGLTDAQNALINLKVQHFIARLQLRRDLGILFINERGMWTP